MSIEVVFTDHQTVRVQCDEEWIEIPLPHASPRADNQSSGAPPPSPAPSTPDRPEKFGRPPLEPGVIGLVQKDTGGSHDGPYEPPDFSFWRSRTDNADVDLHVLRYLTDTRLKSVIEEAKMRAQVSLDCPFVLDVGVRPRQYGEAIGFNALRSIVEDPAHGLAGIRLVQMPDE